MGYHKLERFPGRYLEFLFENPETKNKTRYGVPITRKGRKPLKAVRHLRRVLIFERRRNMETKSSAVKSESLEETQKEIQADLKELKKAKAADFKKGVASHLDILYDVFCESLKVNYEKAETTNMIIEECEKAHRFFNNEMKSAAELLKQILKRVETLENAALFHTIRSLREFEGQPIGARRIKEFAEMFSVDYSDVIAISEALKNGSLKGAEAKE